MFGSQENLRENMNKGRKERNELIYFYMLCMFNYSIYIYFYFLLLVGF